MNDTDRQPMHILLTVLGINPREACYALGTRKAVAKLAPLALMELLPNPLGQAMLLPFALARRWSKAGPICKEASATCAKWRR